VSGILSPCSPTNHSRFSITWTVYGTHLQGDVNGWRRRRQGDQPPEPRLAEWRERRLKHEVRLLSPDERAVVEREYERHCAHRNWRAWAINARSTHVHAVVTATGFSGASVRDQLKANATRGLREQYPQYRDRPVWTVGGDWICINADDDLEQVCQYVRDAQDRMALEGHKETGR
jgi:REP element-mobilizing transposase RayT